MAKIKTGSKNIVANVWTDEARAAALEARRAHAKGGNEESPKEGADPGPGMVGIHDTQGHRVSLKDKLMAAGYNLSPGSIQDKGDHVEQTDVFVHPDTGAAVSLRSRHGGPTYPKVTSDVSYTPGKPSTPTGSKGVVGRGLSDETGRRTGRPEDKKRETLPRPKRAI